VRKTRLTYLTVWRAARNTLGLPLPQTAGIRWTCRRFSLTATRLSARRVCCQPGAAVVSCTGMSALPLHLWTVVPAAARQRSHHVIRFAVGRSWSRPTRRPALTLRCLRQSGCHQSSWLKRRRRHHRGHIRVRRSRTRFHSLICWQSQLLLQLLKAPHHQRSRSARNRKQRHQTCLRGRSKLCSQRGLQRQSSRSSSRGGCHLCCCQRLSLGSPNTRASRSRRWCNRQGLGLGQLREQHATQQQQATSSQMHRRPCHRLPRSLGLLRRRRCCTRSLRPDRRPRRRLQRQKGGRVRRHRLLLHLERQVLALQQNSPHQRWASPAALFLPCSRG